MSETQEPITFVRDGLLFALRAVAIKPVNVSARETTVNRRVSDDDLRAAGYVRVPSAEELAKAIYETDSASWDRALPWERAAKATQSHYFVLGFAARMAALGTLGVTE